MSITKFKITIEEWSGVATWALVFFLTLSIMTNNERLTPNIPIVSGFFIIYILGFLTITKNLLPDRPIYTYLTLIIQLICTYAVVWYVPANYLSILTIIWVAGLLHFVSFRTCVIIAIVVVTTWFGLLDYRWQMDGIWLSAALFGSFHFFAILMSHQTIVAEKATQRAERLNRELLATQNLVEQAGRQQERTRIARDLHDLVGHHLTALSINLEVAKHKSDGEARKHIEQCHALSKLLLSDVREAITEIRENDQISIDALIELWDSYIPGIEIQTEIDERISWHDVTVMQTLSFCILEAITNSLRHAKAKTIKILIKQVENKLKVIISDNGKLKEPVSPGNGLKGMQERLNAIGGKLELTEKEGLMLTITTPVELGDAH